MLNEQAAKSIAAIAMAFGLAVGSARADTGAAPNLWAKNGTYPARRGNDVQILIDGQEAYADINAAMRRAKKFVYATISYGDEDFLMTPAAPQTGETMFDLFRNRAGRGVDVRLVIWQPALDLPDTVPDPTVARKGASPRAMLAGFNSGPGSVQARWDNSPGYLGRPTGAHGKRAAVPFWFPAKMGCNHQKTYIMDDGEGGVVAYVGGINPVQSSWDTPAHDSLDGRRAEKSGDLRRELENHPPRHDVFYRVRGPVAADVLDNFAERYNGADLAHKDATEDVVPPVTAEQIGEVPGGIPAQILRTIAPRKYAARRKGDTSIKQFYLNALNAAGREALVYMENQYFFDPVINKALRGAARRGAKIIAVLTSSPDGGTFRGKLERTWEFLEKYRDTSKRNDGRRNVAILTLGNSRPDPRDPGRTIHSETYVHSKNLFVITPRWSAATGGSANDAFTSMLFHAEENVAFMDPVRIAEDVARLWAEHLRLPLDDAAKLVKDPAAAFAYFKAQAREDKAAMEGGLEPPARVFPWGTRFPARDFQGVDLASVQKEIQLREAEGPAAVAASGLPTDASAAAGTSESYEAFSLPGMKLADVERAAPSGAGTVVARAASDRVAPTPGVEPDRCATRMKTADCRVPPPLPAPPKGEGAG